MPTKNTSVPRTCGLLDHMPGFRHTRHMRLRFIISTLVLLMLSGCNAIGAAGTGSQGNPPQPSTSLQTTYAAPTLPPAYTVTPTVTRTPRPTITATPFTVVSVEPDASATSESNPEPTKTAAFGPWERVEDIYLGISAEIPPGMKAVRSGRSLVITSTSEDSASSFQIELRVDSAIAVRFPQGVDPTQALSVLDGMLGDLESSQTILNVIRPPAGVTLGGNPGASAALRTRPLEEEQLETTLWYVAAIVHEEQKVVRVLASAPESAGVTNLSFAERVAQSLQFLE
jgi:hypothetical protein